MSDNDNFSNVSIVAPGQACFDCGDANVHWASVNNGVYLCLQCAGKHRNYGLHISIIKSITMDKWKESEVALMKAGGNKRLKVYLDKIGYNPKNNVNHIPVYKFKAVEYYRALLHAEVFGEEPPQEIDKYSLWTIVTDNIKSNKEIEKINNDCFLSNSKCCEPIEKNRKKEKSIFKSLTNFFEGGTKKINLSPFMKKVISKTKTFFVGGDFTRKEINLEKGTQHMSSFSDNNLFRNQTKPNSEMNKSFSSSLNHTDYTSYLSHGESN